MLMVDKSTSNRIVSIRVRLAIFLITELIFWAGEARLQKNYRGLRISNLIGKELPCHGSRYRFETVLIRLLRI